MKSLLNRFLNKNEPDRSTAGFQKDTRHHFLEYVISLGSETSYIKENKQRMHSLVFPEETSQAEFLLVERYLTIEHYLRFKDPSFEDTDGKIRKLVAENFPQIANKEAFSPLYQQEKNQEIVLGHHFLKFVINNTITETKSESIASSWFGVLNESVSSKTQSNPVQQIHALRKIKERSRDIYTELSEKFGNECITNIFETSYKTYSHYYRYLPAINSLKTLLPDGCSAQAIPNPKKPVGKGNKIAQIVERQIQKPALTMQVSKNAILENLLEGFVLFDAKGRILENNANALAIFGITEGSIKGHSLSNYLPDAFADKLLTDLGNYEEATQNIIVGSRHEILLRNKKGEEIDFEIAVSNNYTDEVDTFTMLLRNIAHKKDSLKTIKEAKIQAERTGKAKSTFLSNMSHEIRTPLNVILGLSEIIKNNPKMDEELRKKNLDGIDFSAQNLLSIVNDILDFSKIEAGKLSLQSIDFNLKKVITSLADGFEIKALEKGLNLTTEIDASIPEIVIGDQYRLNQILTNLVGNAIKFTQLGGCKIIATLAIENDEEILVEFQVLDTGVGIPEEGLAKIFDSFYQIENPESSKIKGTGLGLAITKELITLQNGHLTAESKINEGSVFKFTIPFKKSKLKGLSDSVKINDHSGKSIAGLHVLVAEDNKMNQFYIRQLLKNFKVTVDIVENGKLAVETYNNNKDKYDLILMDMHMPVMNGIEAIETIRKTHKDAVKKVPIVVCSADVFPEARKDAIKAGIDFYLTKPLSQDAIKEVLYWLISDEDFTPNKLSAGTNTKKNSSGMITTYIDINQLNENFDRDSAFIVTLLEAFIKETPEEFTSLRSCVDREFYSRASELANQMKARFMDLGMTNHGHHLKQIETLVISKKGLDEAKKHLGAFSKIYTKALLEVNMLLIEYRQK